MGLWRLGGLRPEVWPRSRSYLFPALTPDFSAAQRTFRQMCADWMCFLPGSKNPELVKTCTSHLHEGCWLKGTGKGRQWGGGLGDATLWPCLWSLTLGFSFPGPLVILITELWFPEPGRHKGVRLKAWPAQPDNCLAGYKRTCTVCALQRLPCGLHLSWQSGPASRAQLCSWWLREGGWSPGEFLENMGKSCRSWQGTEGTPKWGP